MVKGPSFPRLYSADKAALHTIVSGNFTLNSAVASNCSDLFNGEFGGTTPLTTICSSVSDLVSVISSWRIPSKISKGVILTISVIVTAFHAKRFRADKSRENERMNPEHGLGVIAPQRYEWARICWGNSDFFKFPSLGGSNVPQVRNFIGKSWYLSPLFHIANMARLGDVVKCP